MRSNHLLELPFSARASPKPEQPSDNRLLLRYIGANVELHCFSEQIVTTVRTSDLGDSFYWSDFPFQQVIRPS